MLGLQQTHVLSCAIRTSAPRSSYGDFQLVSYTGPLCEDDTCHQFFLQQVSWFWGTQGHADGAQLSALEN